MYYLTLKRSTSFSSPLVSFSHCSSSCVQVFFMCQLIQLMTTIKKLQEKVAALILRSTKDPYASMRLTTPNPSSVPPSPSAYNHHHSFLYFPFSNFSWPLQPAQLPPTDGQPLPIYPDVTYHHLRPSLPRLPSTVWSQPPFSVSAIVPLR